MGKRGSDADFPDGVDKALKSGAEVFTSPRGGETTYHGPGQLVLYPIVNLRELRLGARKYVETLEDIMIDTAATFGVKARVCSQKEATHALALAHTRADNAFILFHAFYLQ